MVDKEKSALIASLEDLLRKLHFVEQTIGMPNQSLTLHHPFDLNGIKDENYLVAEFFGELPLVWLHRTVLEHVHQSNALSFEGIPSQNINSWVEWLEWIIPHHSAADNSAKIGNDRAK